MKMLTGKTMKKSYRSRVFVTFFLYSMISLIALGMTISMVFYATLHKNIEEQASANTRQISYRLSTLIQDGEGIIEMLQADHKILDFFESADASRMDVMRELYLIRSSLGKGMELSVIDAATGSWVTTNEEHKTANLYTDNMSDWGIFRMANNAENTVILTTVKENFLSPGNRIMVAKAYRKDDSIQGYLLLEITRSALSEIISAQINPYNTSLIIANNQMAVIFHSDGTDHEGLGKLDSYGDVNLLQEDNGVIFSWESFTCIYNDYLKLYIMWEIPSNVLSGVLVILVRILLLAIFVLLIISGFLSHRIAGSIVLPVQNLTTTMAKMKQGDMSVRAEVNREDEFGELANSFNSMADRIEVLMKNVDEEKHSLWIAETRSLNLQMNPHFLYNTLDVIKWEAKMGNVQEVEDIVVKLGRVLRRVMSTSKDLVTLAYEMEIVEAFVDIMKFHYDDLKLQEDVEENVREMIIPKLMVEPIVENAIVHGFANMSKPCRINLTANVKEPYIMITVTDNGMGMSPQEVDEILDFRQTNTHHIGLSNVDRRAKLYGDEICGLTVQSDVGKGTTILLRLKIFGDTQKGEEQKNDKDIDR